MSEILKSNFIGLPLNVYNLLPEEIQNTLTDIKYTPEIIWGIVINYFDGKFIEPFAKLLVQNWQKKFEGRLKKSTDDKAAFIEREIRKYSYDQLFNKVDIADLEKSLEHWGYNIAREGNDEGFTFMYSKRQIKGLYLTPLNVNDYDSLQNYLSYIKSAIRGFALSFFLQKIKTELSSKYLNDVEQEFDRNPKEKKLKWLGTPAQFGFIIQELIGKGYLETPTSSLKKDAIIYRAIFDIETTDATLSKELSCKTNSMSADNARLLKLTHIDKLNKNNQTVTEE